MADTIHWAQTSGHSLRFKQPAIEPDVHSMLEPPARKMLCPCWLGNVKGILQPGVFGLYPVVREEFGSD
jgi:hypothetical protein